MKNLIIIVIFSFIVVFPCLAQTPCDDCDCVVQNARKFKKLEQYDQAINKYLAAKRCETNEANKQIIDDEITDLLLSLNDLRKQALVAEQLAENAKVVIEKQKIISDSLRIEAESQKEEIVKTNIELNNVLKTLEIKQIETDSVLTELEAEQIKSRKIIDAFYFYDDKLALAYKEGKYGFIDKEGNVKIDYQYDEALPFGNRGFAHVKIKQQTQKARIIDYVGESVIIVDTIKIDYLLDTLGKEYQYTNNLRQFSKFYDPPCVLDLSQQKKRKISRKIGTYDINVLLLAKNKFNRLPFDILKHKNLKIIDLSFNKLNTLPENFGQLMKLQHLNLSNNNILNTLPESFGQLSNLKYLDLSNNNALKKLPESFGLLTNLQYLNLSSSNFFNSGLRSESALNTLPDNFKLLTNLHTLVINDNNSLAKNFDEIVKQLPINLRNLDLSYNLISSLPEDLGQLTNLQTLDLKFNLISVLPESLKQLTNLQILDLRFIDNLKDFTSLSSFSQEIIITILNSELFDSRAKSKEKNILHIYISNYKDQLPVNLQTLKNLKQLDIRKSNFNTAYITQLKKDLPWCEVLH